MTEQQKNQAELTSVFVGEILAAKKRFIIGALKRILPPELFELAKASKEEARVAEWAKKEGYRWMEVKGETLLMKHNMIVGRFRPTIVGEKEAKHCEFLAFVLGQQIPVADRTPSLG